MVLDVTLNFKGTGITDKEITLKCERWDYECNRDIKVFPLKLFQYLGLLLEAKMPVLALDFGVGVETFTLHCVISEGSISANEQKFMELRNDVVKLSFLASQVLLDIGADIPGVGNVGIIYSSSDHYEGKITLFSANETSGENVIKYTIKFIVCKDIEFLV